ncbi:hypothetical protein L916_01429 [Phytophthora nicotianae]|uniref:Uncharacterized protein n=1 Tax=Phytophthora nicotianae TaxID=4792 RepID=W2JRK2_PHYNI|nr:hypothetical protein L916_01429 [Phytophthora nicotianae]
MEILDDYSKLITHTNAGQGTLLQTLVKGLGGEINLLLGAKEISSYERDGGGIAERAAEQVDSVQEAI